MTTPLTTRQLLLAADEALRCPWCRKLKARRHVAGSRMVFAPEPTNPAIHCTCTPDQPTRDLADERRADTDYGETQ